MKSKYQHLLFFLLISVALQAQYNYGLEVCDQDVKIEGRLNLVSDTTSVYIGTNAGINTPVERVNNVFVGYEAGRSYTYGHNNTLVGHEAGLKWIGGSSNTIVGQAAAFNSENLDGSTIVGSGAGFFTSGSGNVLIGDGAGFYKTGSHNVIIGQFSGSGDFLNIDFNNPMPIDIEGSIFIGFKAGEQEVNSNRLYIENSNSSSPLIYGEFDNDKVQINGSFHVTDFAQLQPRATAPTSPEKGTIYYDSTTDKVKVWTGSAWENLN